MASSSSTTSSSTLTEISAAMTKPELLDQVNAAIAAVLVGGQSYRIGSRQLERANLKQLQALRDELAAEVEAENGNTGLFDDCYVGVFDKR